MFHNFIYCSFKPVFQIQTHTVVRYGTVLTGSKSKCQSYLLVLQIRICSDPHLLLGSGSAFSVRIRAKINTDPDPYISAADRPHGYISNLIGLT